MSARVLFLLLSALLAKGEHRAVRRTHHHLCVEDEIDCAREGAQERRLKPADLMREAIREGGKPWQSEAIRGNHRSLVSGGSLSEREKNLTLPFFRWHCSRSPSYLTST